MLSSCDVCDFYKRDKTDKTDISRRQQISPCICPLANEKKGIQVKVFWYGFQFFGPKESIN